MDTSNLVHFDGEWPTDERELLETTTWEVETAKYSGPARPGALWVAIRKDTTGGKVYMASRQGENDVLVERSATDLANRIRSLSGRDGDR